jgi:curved DNA-binding protein
MKYKDYYAILGVDKNASEKEIKMAFKKLAKKYHPDKNQGDKQAEERFKEISEAHEVLSDPEKRNKYDQLGENWEAFEQGGFHWGNDMGGARRTYTFRGDPSEFFGSRGGRASGFSDFFEAFFGGGMEDLFHTPFEQGRRQMRGRDLQADLPITLEEAYHGGAKEFAIDGQRLRIQIKPGAYEGQKLVLRGKGAPGPDGRAGDLYLILRQAPHPLFERQGDDLVHEVKVDLYDAVLGGKIEAPTLSGIARVNLRPGTQPGQTLRLRGKGMPLYDQPGAHGDLLLNVSIEIPKNLSDKELRLFEQLRNFSNSDKDKRTAK